MLSELDILLESQLQGQGLLMEAERHLTVSLSAKRVRPKFLFACGKLLDIPESRLINIACAVELIHTASILHDDIVDKTNQRRSVESVNSKYGNTIAVLAGDQLLSRALILLANEKNADEIIKLTSQAMLQMSFAAAEEINADQNFDNALKIIDGKTGALFALCGSLVGVVAGDNKAKDNLSKVGLLLGRIFQLNDDIKDIDEDIESGVMTIPQITGVKSAIIKADEYYQQILDEASYFSGNSSYSDFELTIRKILNR